MHKYTTRSNLTKLFLLLCVLLSAGCSQWKNPDETYRDIVHPINAEFRGILEDAVKSAYDAELEALANAEENEIV